MINFQAQINRFELILIHKNQNDKKFAHKILNIIKMDRMKRRESVKQRKKVRFDDDGNDQIVEQKFVPSKSDLELKGEVDFDFDGKDKKTSSGAFEEEFDEEEECDAGCKISKGINTKLGFTGWVCRAGDKTCQRNNIILIVATFFVVWAIAWMLLKYSRPKIILDQKGHVVQRKLVLYSFMFGLIGPILYLSYLLITA